MSLSNYTEGKFLGHLTGRSWPAPLATFIILYNTPPTDSGGGTPITDAIAQSIYWTAPTLSSTVSNQNTIIWTAASDWGVVGGYAVLDAQVGAANILFFDSLDGGEDPVEIGDQFTIGAGDIVLSMD